MISQRQLKRSGKSKRKKDREHRKKTSNTARVKAANTALLNKKGGGNGGPGAPLGAGAAKSRLSLKRGEKEIIFDVLDSLDRLQARRKAALSGAPSAPQAPSGSSLSLPSEKVSTKNVWTAEKVKKLEKHRKKQEKSLAKEIKAAKKAQKATEHAKQRSAQRTIDPASTNVRIELTTLHKSGEKKIVVVPRCSDLKDLLKKAKAKFNRKPNKIKKPTRAFLVETNASGSKTLQEMKDTQSMCDGDLIMVTEKDVVPDGFVTAMSDTEGTKSQSNKQNMSTGETQDAQDFASQNLQSNSSNASIVQRMRNSYKRMCRQDSSRLQSKDGTCKSGSDSKVSAEQGWLQKRAELTTKSDNYRAMQDVRKSLPSADHKSQILNAIFENKVVVISGETGCGKTTQIPQFILEHAIETGNGGGCQIICTQPRRISAIGVANRVAAERHEKIGESVGYQIRLQRRVGSHTHLTFCTTGILLRRLTGDPDLTGITHIVLDEVHEREILSDFLLILLRELIRTSRPDLKVILMSATVNADLFASYFSVEETATIEFSNSGSSSKAKKGAFNHSSQPSQRFSKKLRNRNIAQEVKLCTPCPCLHISGRTFPVKRFTLEDIVEILNYRTVFAGRQNRFHAKGGRSQSSPKPFLKNADGKRYKDTTLEVVDRMEQSKINYDLITVLVANICNNKFRMSELGDTQDNGANAILIFMPGKAEIARMCKKLREVPDIIGQDGKAALILPLHGSLTSHEQTRVFSKPPSGVRKIVVSTNIAETSVTIDDIVCVIDSGRVKQIQYNEASKCPALVETWVSKASTKQRQGRAGRVRPGICFQMFSREKYEDFLEFQIPEIRRKPLEDLILQIRLLQLDADTSPAEFLQRAIEAPSSTAIEAALANLRDMGALSNDETVGSDNIKMPLARNELTPLGFHLANLPVGAKLGKLLLFGCIFRCIEPALTIAAAMSCRGPFISPQNAREEARLAKLDFSQYQSDLLTIVRAFDCWQMVRSHKKVSDNLLNETGTQTRVYRNTREFCKDYFLSDATMCTIANMREQFRRQLKDIGFLRAESTNSLRSEEAPMLSLWGNEDIEGECNGNGRDVGILRSIICAALYPNVVCIRRTDTRGYSGRRRAPERYTTQTEEVHVHPGSINFKSRNMASPLKHEAWLVYHEKQMTSRMYLYDTNVVTPYMLFLWGDKVDFSYAEETIRIDDWIEFKSTAEAFTLFKRLRAEIQKTLAMRIEDPNSDAIARDERILIDAVSVLFNSERDTGLLETKMIGRPKRSSAKSATNGTESSLKNMNAKKRRQKAHEGGQIMQQRFDIDSI